VAFPHSDHARAPHEDSAPAPSGAQRPLSSQPAGQPNPVARSTAPAWSLLARLIRPHGRRGELVADILTDFPELFHSRTQLFLIPPDRIGTSAREMILENFWFLRSRIVLKFQGIDSINEAESLRGFTVAVPSTQRAPLAPGSVYVSDLVGCRLRDLNHAADIGEIVDVDRGSSSTDLLVVRRPGMRQPQAEALIPFVNDYLVRIDLDNRIVEMRLPEGLLDINAPLTEEEKREQHSA
jgi:16S rRNA processing protein RimM